MTRPDYDWNAYWNGNLIQRWWKHQIAQKVIGMIGNCNPVLDLGCGSSPLLSLLPCKKKTGLELDVDKVMLMRNKDNTSEYIWGRAEDTHLPSSSYSAILCIEVIEHHPEPHKLVAEISRLLCPKGKAIIATPDFASPLWNVIEIVYGILMKSGYHKGHDYKFTETGVKALASSCNLEHVRTDKVLGADLVMEFTKI